MLAVQLGIRELQWLAWIIQRQASLDVPFCVPDLPDAHNRTGPTTPNARHRVLGEWTGDWAGIPEDFRLGCSFEATALEGSAVPRRRGEENFA